MLTLLSIPIQKKFGLVNAEDIIGKYKVQDTNDCIKSRQHGVTRMNSNRTIEIARDCTPNEERSTLQTMGNNSVRTS